MASTSVLDFTTVSNENTDGLQPARPGVYKFMLISEVDTMYLVLGPVSEFGYHADLVECFCSRRGIVSAWVKKPDVENGSR